MSHPVICGPFRLRATGLEHVPAEGGFVLAANHTSNLDPWPLGMPLFPRRYLRFMAKSELYWWPLRYVLHGGGAFPVRRGQNDIEAIRTAVELVRAGHVVAMFPEGTRRRKGLVKKHQPRAHSGAARIAIDAQAPLVPAAIKGTDRLTRFGPLRVAYGAPLELSDDAAETTERLMAEIRWLAGDVVTRPLLVVDGDSFAHRAYHALPKTIRRADGRPAGALVGFSNMLLRLWENEQPRAVLVAWDTLEVPTYRHEAFDAYQGGREFDADLLEQLPLLPQLVESFGFAVAKGAGYEADDFLAAGAAYQEERGEPTLVATSDRDAFQLASERTTILQPTRGVSELARIGPDEVRERYGVEPAQVPDFIALRGDPSDKLPGAKGVGPKTAADLLRQYGSLEGALGAGRFGAQAEELRLYRRIATLDASAPLPPLDDQTPAWAEASSFARQLEMNALAERLAGLSSS